MKLNPNILKALKSGQMVLLATLLFALILLMAFFPSYSWLIMLIGSLFIVWILAVALASGFENETEILKRK